MLARARRAAIHDRHASNQHAAPLKPGQWCLSIILLFFFFFKVGVGHFMGIMRALSPQLGGPPGILGKFSHGAHQETGPFLEKYHSEARWFMGGPPITFQKRLGLLTKTLSVRLISHSLGSAMDPSPGDHLALSLHFTLPLTNLRSSSHHT